MRNLKRALSLALASIMVIGLMVTGAGAVSVEDFTDKDEIQHQEAVTTMVALGVINGKEDGSYFDPTGIVTRAEMAKMITVALNGGTDPVLATKTTPSYSDIDGHWAENYIEYCTSRSIISGRGNGKFDPDATVTAAEAAKMILTALGYDATVFGLTGTSWQIKTDVLANDSKADLYNGLSNLSSSNDLTRDNAARMIYNALDAYVMERSYDQVLANGQVTYSYKLSETTTFIMDAFGAVKVEGVVVGNEAAVLSTSATGSHLDANRTRIQVTNYGTGDGEQNSFNGTLTLQSATGLDELGRTVSVYVKSSSSASRATVLGSVIVSGDNVVVTDYSGDSIAKVADDNNLNLVSGTQTARNYANVASYVSGVAGNSTRGVEKILVDNDSDGDLDYVLLNTYRFGKVTSYVTTGDGSITVNCGSSNTFSRSDKDDVVGFEDVAKDNYVLAAEIGGRLYVEKAESVTGSLDGYRESTGVAADISASSATYTNRLSVDDKNYNVAWLTGYTGGADNIAPAYNYGSNNLENEASFYLGKGDYVLAVGEVTANAYNYALVLAKDSGINNLVRVALPDGTVSTYTLTSSGSNVAFGAVEVGEVYSYSLSGTSNIRLNAPVRQVTDRTNNTVTFTKGRTSINNVNSTTYYANSSTVFFYLSDTTAPSTGHAAIPGSSVNVYTGYNSAPTLSSVSPRYVDVYTRSATSGQTGYTSAAVVVFRGASLATTNVDDNLYIYGKGNTSSDYTNVSAFVAGSADAVTSLRVDGAYAGSEGVHTYTVNSDGYYELSTPGDYAANSSTGNLLTGAFTNGVSDWTVSSANSNTFVITKGGTSYELEITANTLLVNDSSYLDDPTAELGAGPDEDDNIAYILFSRDNSNRPDEAKLIVIKNSSSGNTPVVSTDVKVVASSVTAGNDYSAPLFYRESGAAISPAEMRTALTNKMVADGCTNITFDGFAKVTYTPAGASSSQTDTFSGGLTQAANQAYKVTVGTTNYYAIAGKTFKNTGSNGGTNLVGTYFLVTGTTSDSTTPTATSTGYTVSANDGDVVIDDGYVTLTASTSGEAQGLTVALASTAYTGNVKVVSGTAYVKAGAVVTVHYTVNGTVAGAAGNGTTITPVATPAAPVLAKVGSNAGITVSATVITVADDTVTASASDGFTATYTIPNGQVTDVTIAAPAIAAVP